jgi:hypothetical protein
MDPFLDLGFQGGVLDLRGVQDGIIGWEGPLGLRSGEGFRLFRDRGLLGLRQGGSGLNCRLRLGLNRHHPTASTQEENQGCGENPEAPMYHQRW